jgi:hypothetical protein
VIFHQPVTKFFERASCVLGGIRRINSVMKMNLYLTESFILKGSQHLQEGTFILFRRIEIRMAKRRAIVITNSVARFTGQLHPMLNPWNCLFSRPRFPVVGHEKDDMSSAGPFERPSPNFTSAPERITQ